MRTTRKIKVGNTFIGGGERITVQSMTNTHTCDNEATLKQINALKTAGCDIVRLAVCNDDDINACRKIIGKTDVPLVADIQFDYKLAIACSDIGFDKIRFNPGNIGSDLNVKSLVDACKANSTPIRVGVNLGSLDKDILNKYGRTATALSKSALSHVKLLEKFGFYDTVVSVKASDVRLCVDAYRQLHDKCDYPLHLGITESGAAVAGIVKSSIGIGSLLLGGIGDTVRVSLTGDPVEEVKAAKLILQSLGLRRGCEIISCPTCSRCNINLSEIYNEVEKLLQNVTVPIKVAVMGCVVNGPGEAADADLGVAGGLGKSVIFSHGKILKTVANENIMPELKKLINEAVKKD